MFLQSMQVTGVAVLEIFLLAAVGFFLVKKGVLKDEGLDALSRLMVKVTLPLLIFSRLVREFDFHSYPNWWIFPLLSIAITILGLAAGLLFARFLKNDRQYRTQFLSLTTFQNSGYLPLALVVTLLPSVEANPMLIYIFLFLLGFDLVMWSAGVYMLTRTFGKKFELASVFSPPVIANLAGLLCVFLGVNLLLPAFIVHPLRMIGDCTVPLAMLVVGGNLAKIHLDKIDIKAAVLLILVKQLLLPALGLWAAVSLKLPMLIGLFVVMQLAMPPATSLSVVIRHYKKDDLLISEGIFVGHLAALVTLPLFLSLYFALVMIK